MSAIHQLRALGTLLPPTLLATAERTAATQGTALASASTSTAGALKATAAAAREAVNPLEGVATTLRSVAGVGVAGILGSQTAQMLRSVAETADAYANLQARIKLVTGEGANFNSAMQGIADIALRTNSNLEATGGLFARLAQAGKEIGIGQEAALKLTETINQAVQLSGASATASDAAITQLVQGLQGGVLRGDEFNSVMEQAPRLAQALATGLGVTTGELRKMAEAGQLSAETVIRALQSQSATLQKEFGSLPATVGRALENLNTKWALFVGNLNSGTSATASVASGINALANNLETVAGVATRAGSVLVAALAVQGVGALRGLAVQMATTGGAAALLSKNLNDIPKVINIAVAAVGFEIGFQIGEMLRENSSLARKLGVGIVEYFVSLANGLQFLKEAAAAVFSNDTIEASLDRFKARVVEQQKLFSQLYKDAEEPPEVTRARAAEAKRELAELGETAKTAGAQVATAGTTGAAGLAAITKAATEANTTTTTAATTTAAATTAAADSAGAALQGLAEALKEANKGLPAVSAEAARQADVLVKLALAGGKAAETFRVQLPEAIAKLSGPELQQFSQAITQRLSEARTEALRLAEQLTAAGQSGAKAFATAEQAARLLSQVAVDVGTRAAEALGVDVAAAGTAVSKEFATAESNLSQLVRSLPALQKAGVDTGAVVSQALAKMIDGARNQAEIDAITARINALGRAGEISARQVAGAFDLAKEKGRSLKEAFEDATPGMANLGEAARKAGVDVALLTGGITKGGRESIDTISDLVDQVVRTGVSAERASPVLAAAFDKRVEAAQTKEELQRLIAEMERASNAGYNLGGVLSSELEKARKKAAELNPELARINEAIRKMGGTPIGEKGPAGSTSNPTNASGGGQSNGQSNLAGIDPQAPDTRDASGRTAYQRDLMSKQGGPVDNSYIFQLQERLRQGDSFSASEIPAIENALRAAKVNARLSTGASVQSLSGNADATAWVSTLNRVLALAKGTALQASPAGQATPSAAGDLQAGPTGAVGAGGSTRTLKLDLGGGRSVDYQATSAAEAARVETLLRTLAAESTRSA